MPETPFNPFPGLRAFRTDEDYLFFGREGQSEDVLRQLRLHRFLAVVGISGSGKSSLIRAGLLPYLFGGFMAGAGSHWRVALFRPGDNPLGNLAHALSDTGVLGRSDSDPTEAAKTEIMLEITLRRTGLGLIDAVRLARLPEDENLLIVVDQFEELFRYSKADDSIAQQDDAAAFVKLLVEAAEQSTIPIYIVITMRSDFIGDCARFRDLPEAVTDGLYLIPRMSRDQRRRAIEDPVRVGNGSISRRLVNRLLNDGGDDPDRLPALQHALMRTWNYWQAHKTESQPMDLSDYVAIGGIAHALSQHAEEAFAELPNERSRAIAKRLFQSLTEKGPDSREVRRPTKLAEIVAMTGAETAGVVAVVDHFRREECSFLTPPPEVRLHTESVIDISHESLIRGWGRLKEWVEEEYESAKMYLRLAETAALHAEGKAGLWADPDLANALRWRLNEKPTAAWGRYYNPNFEQAMAFLESSVFARDQAAAQREQNRIRKLSIAWTFAAASLLLFVGAAAMAFWAIENGREATQNLYSARSEEQLAREAEAKAKDAQLLADRNADKERDASTKAQVNQDMALNFANSTVHELSDLDDFILSQHGAQDKLESLFTQATGMHDLVMLNDPNNFPALVLQANGSAALARLHRATGHSESAEKDYEKQEKEGNDLGKNGDPFQRLLGAYLLAGVGEERARTKDQKGALADSGRAVAIVESLSLPPQQNENEQQALRCKAYVYSVARYVQDKYGDSNSALKYAAAAVNTFVSYENEAGVDASGNQLDVRSRQALIQNLQTLASLQTKYKLQSAADVTSAKAIRLATKWGEKDPEVEQTLFNLYLDRGDAEKARKDYDRSAQDFNAAQKISSKRLQADSSNGHRDAALIDERFGNLELDRANDEPDKTKKQKDLDTAMSWHQNALTGFKVMESTKGKNPDLEEAIGIEEYNLGLDSEGLGQSGKEHYVAALRSFELAADVEQNDEYKQSAASASRKLAELEQQESAEINHDEQKLGESEQHAQLAIRYWKEAVKYDADVHDPDPAAWHHRYRDAEQLAEAEADSKNKNEVKAALDTTTEAIATAEKTPDSTTTTNLVTDLIDLYLERGDIRRQQKEYASAQQDYDTAKRKLLALDMNTSDAKYLKSLVYERLGNLWNERANAETDDARKKDYLQQARDAQLEVSKQRHRLETSGATAEIESSIAISERNLGWVSYERKDYEQARQHYTDGVRASEQVIKLQPTEQAKTSLQFTLKMLSAVEVDYGTAELAHGNDAAARKHFEDARQTAQRPETEGIALQSMVEQYIAQAFLSRANSETGSPRDEHLKKALQADQADLALRQQMAAVNNTDETQRGIAEVQKRIGRDYYLLGDKDNAEKAFSSSLDIYKKLQPNLKTAQQVADTYELVASFEESQSNHQATRTALSDEIKMLRPFLDSRAAREKLATAFGARSWDNLILGNFWDALSDADEGLVLDPTKHFIRVNQGDAYLLLGQVGKARDTYLAIAEEKCAESKRCGDSILEDLAEIENHPEFKVDPNVIANLREALKKPSKPQQAFSTQSSELK